MRSRRERVTRVQIDSALCDVFQAPGEAFEQTFKAMKEALRRPGRALDDAELAELAELADSLGEPMADVVLEVVPKGSTMVEEFTVFDVVVGRPSRLPSRKPVLAVHEATGSVDLHVPQDILANWSLVRLRDGRGVYGFSEPLGVALGPADVNADPVSAGPSPSLSVDLPSETVGRLLGLARGDSVKK